MKTYTPLRYPGGKSKLTPFIKEVFKSNRLLDGTYVEPYAGGSAVALSLLCDGYAGKIIINDFDFSIFAFWHSAIFDTEKFINKLLEIPVTMIEWGQQKEIYENPKDFSLFELGFATFFLNRTNHSGIIKGGVIGGKNQTGKYPIDARFKKKGLIDRIRFISGFRNRISVHNCDAIDLIDGIPLGNKSLIYLDPPYYVKGSCLYKNYYTHNDHKKIADRFDDINTPCIITYDNVKQIQELYQHHDYLDFQLRYSANKTRCKGSEIMIYKNIELPETKVI